MNLTKEGILKQTNFHAQGTLSDSASPLGETKLILQTVAQIIGIDWLE